MKEIQAGCLHSVSSPRHPIKCLTHVATLNTRTRSPCDVNLSFSAHPAEITGRVRFLHPLHNFALVSYKVADLPAEARTKVRVSSFSKLKQPSSDALGAAAVPCCARRQRAPRRPCYLPSFPLPTPLNAQVRAAALLPSPRVARGDSVRLVGLSRALRIMQRTSTVTNAATALTIPGAEVPRCVASQLAEPLSERGSVVHWQCARLTLALAGISPALRCQSAQLRPLPAA